jgi:2',3'-cyclic-nucleotide 2'-phosphodiesterase / 3'-nucleotidase
VRDIAEAAAAWVPEMREAGADLVVALSHSGIAAGGPQGAENASLHVAGVEGVDVVVTGHQHQLFPGPTFAGIDGVDQAAGRLRGKPAVMPGFWGSHLGVVDLALARDGGAWRVMDSAVETRPIYERVDNKPRALVGSEEAILAVARPAHEATLAYVRRPVGRTSVPIQSYFALVADDPSVQVVNDAQLWYARKLHAEGPHRDLPLLAAAAPFKAGGRGGPDYYTDVPAGDLAIRNIADIYLYPNTLRAVLVDGRTLKEWLERSAGIFRRIDPQAGGEQALIDPAFPSFNFDVIDGVTYEIDVTRPARYATDGALADAGAERIVSLRHGGRPVDPAQRFVVVTNNYRAGGGGKFPGLDGGNVVLEAPDLNRDVVVRYVKEAGAIAPAADGNWRLAPTLGGARVVFETGPGAERYAAERRDVARVGPAEGGFVRYEVRPA